MKASACIHLMQSQQFLQQSTSNNPALPHTWTLSIADLVFWEPSDEHTTAAAKKVSLQSDGDGNTGMALLPMYVHTCTHSHENGRETCVETGEAGRVMTVSASDTGEGSHCRRHPVTTVLKALPQPAPDSLQTQSHQGNTYVTLDVMLTTVWRVQTINTPTWKSACVIGT